MTSTVSPGTIRTRIPARLDRLPWTRFHWRIVVGLGTVWILDGLEVTIIGSIASRLTEAGSGVSMTAADIGYAAAIYVAGACLGALFFGQLTDRHGRKKLMMLTLAIYVVATVATAFTFAPWYFFLCRFVTGMGIGGEYAAINSAIDELIPARNRGQVDITINGSYWVGSALGGLAALLFLDTAIFALDFGWRVAFAVGGVLGLGILLVRRHVPESPRWLFIHGREDEAERIVDRIEREVREESQHDLGEAGDAMTVRQREAIPFREIAKVAVRLYPKRSILGLALFVGQAFLYNAVTFDLGTLLSGFFGVASGAVPYFMVIFAAVNFMGPFVLGRLFDTVGRKPMITGTYLLSAALTVLLAAVLLSGGFNQWSFIAVVGVTFFFASAGASSAYLTVSEIFPMETRALAIAFFYAVGTAVGGITGPLLFGSLINTGNAGLVAIGFFVGAAVMALGGLAEIAFGVRAEGVSLENIAKPLTVADAERQGEAGQQAAPAGAEPETGSQAELSPERRAALDCRARAAEERSRAAEHQAAAHELGARQPRDADTERRIHAEEVLAQIAQWHAEGLEAQAVSHDEQAEAADASEETQRRAALSRAEAARERARVAEERATALSAEQESDAEYHAALADAASERARAREQLSRAEEARGAAAARSGTEAEIAGVQVEMYDAWSRMHDERAASHLARAEGRHDDADAHIRQADTYQEQALAAEQRVDMIRQREAASDLQRRQGALEERERARAAAAERERLARERDERIRQRVERRLSRQHRGLRRFRPGPGSMMYSPGLIGTAAHWSPSADQDLDREISSIDQALREHGPTDRARLAQLVGARYWGPGRFRAALDDAEDEGRIRRLSRDTYGPVTSDAADRAQ